MSSYLFHKQAWVPFISEEALAKFNMERFRFANAPQNDVAAAVTLLESAMGDRKADLSKIYGDHLYQQVATKDDTVW